ncbi:MAG: hypothetical protein RIQ45_1088 [Actinomycetota bacterium]|jgi:hypothetical protein
MYGRISLSTDIFLLWRREMAMVGFNVAAAENIGA